MSPPPPETSQPTGDARPDRGISEFGEDATGFGTLELRTAWHTLIRPAAVLEAYMTGGPTGHGLYARPLRLYLALCGILMLMLFLMGGSTIMLAGLPPELIQPLIDQSGKSRDAFMGDADNWMTLVLVPITAVFYALCSAPLLRWWDPDHLGWRKSFRATFLFLNAWTIPILPIGWLGYHPAFAGWSMIIFTIVSVVAFLRAGRGRWYRSMPIGVAKALLLTLVTMIGGGLAFVPIMAIGLIGGAVVG